MHSFCLLKWKRLPEPIDGLQWECLQSKSGGISHNTHKNTVLDLISTTLYYSRLQLNI